MCLHKLAVFSSSCMAAALCPIRQTSRPPSAARDVPENKLTNICSDSSHVLLNHSRAPLLLLNARRGFIWQWGWCASRWCHFLWQSAHDAPAGMKKVAMERRGDKSPRCAYTGTVTGWHLRLLLQTHWRDTLTSFLSYYRIMTLSPKQQWPTDNKPSRASSLWTSIYQGLWSICILLWCQNSENQISGQCHSTRERRFVVHVST